MNPYLPPPVGRMRLTANPFMMIKGLMSPQMFLRLTLCICCGGCLAVMAVFGSTIMSTLTYIQAMQKSGGGGALLPSSFPGLDPFAYNKSSTNSLH